MQFLLAAAILIQDDPAFGTTRSDVPVVGRPRMNDEFETVYSDVPVVGRPGMGGAEAEAFAESRAEVPVAGRPDLGGGMRPGWSRRTYLTRALAEPVAEFHVVDLKAPAAALSPPSIAATFLQSSVSLVPPSVAGAAAAPAPAAASTPAADPGSSSSSSGSTGGSGSGGRGP